MSTQIDAHTGIEGMEPGCPLGAPWAHWGRALRMAFTSSATAVRANSNWSWEGQREEGHGKAWSLLSLKGPLGSGAVRSLGSRGRPPGGGTQQAGGSRRGSCCRFSWGKVAVRVGAGRNSHLRADQARSLVTDMLQGGGDVDLLHSWGQEAQGCSGGVQRRTGPRKLGKSGWEAWRIGQSLGLGCRHRGKVLTFRHAVQDHVDEDVGAGPPCTITETGEGHSLSSAQLRMQQIGGEGRRQEGLGWEGTGGAIRTGLERCQ